MSSKLVMRKILIGVNVFLAFLNLVFLIVSHSGCFWCFVLGLSANSLAALAYYQSLTSLRNKL